MTNEEYFSCRPLRELLEALDDKTASALSKFLEAKHEWRCLYSVGDIVAAALSPDEHRDGRLGVYTVVSVDEKSETYVVVPTPDVLTAHEQLRALGVDSWFVEAIRVGNDDIRRVCGHTADSELHWTIGHLKTSI